MNLLGLDLNFKLQVQMTANELNIIVIVFIPRIGPHCVSINNYFNYHSYRGNIGKF